MMHLMMGFIAAAMSFSVWAQSSFDISAVPFNQVVSLYYKEVAKTPYVLCSDVLLEARPVSVRGAGKVLDGPIFKALLDAHGFEAKHVSGVDIVCKKSAVENDTVNEVFVYKPLYRDTAYLVDIASSIVHGSFANKRTSAGSLAVSGTEKNAGNAVASATAPPAPTAAPSFKAGIGDDSIVFFGTKEEAAKLQKLLAQIDIKSGEVIVRGIVYEVGSTDKEGSAFSLALSLLSGKFSMIGGAAGMMENSVRFKNHTIDAVFSALSSDSRFKVVSSPSLRVRSGGTGRFSVGQEVPVLGSVSYSGNGQVPVQSVEYRSSGVIFDLQPVVRDAVVDLNVTQQISSFVPTETGVNNSPTLIKREVKTALSLADGDIVILGGLAENKESAGRNGLSFLPSLLHTKTNESSKSEILLVLQLTKL